MERKEKNLSLCKFALEYSVLCLDQQHFLLCLLLSICRLCPQFHSGGLLCGCSDPAGKRPSVSTQCGGRNTLRSILKCDQQAQGRPTWCRRPSDGRFDYRELSGIKWAKPGSGETRVGITAVWIRVRAVAMCSVNGSELHLEVTLWNMRSGWRLIP